MKLIKYPKTSQFRDVVRDVTHKATFKGIDDEGNPIYDSTVEKPKILFVGSVKLHGTNAGVSYDGTNIWVQSRNNVIDSLTGHMGFAEFVHQNTEWFTELFNKFHEEGITTTIYGEWCGPGVQRGVAISDIPEKMFFIFGVKITPAEGAAFWLPDYTIPNTNGRIWNLWDMTTFQTEIDFEKPDRSIEYLTKITEEVERECPIAKAFGISGIGEGVVWEGWYEGDRHIFKVKGEKHSSSKVKKLAQVDTEKMNSVYDFVDYSVTPNRVDQAMYEISGGSIERLSKKDTPNVLRWIANDIISEESDVLQESKLEWKDVAKAATDKARKIFFDRLDQQFRDESY